jgi:O-antigen chain-terminating methyltransferase
MTEPHADPANAPQPPATAIDTLLRTGRPLLDRLAAPAGRGPAARLRKPLAGILAPLRTGWFGEQRRFEEHLRAALAEIAVRLQREQAAREETDEAVRALERSAYETRVHVDARMKEVVGEVQAALGGLLERIGSLENLDRAAALERIRGEATRSAAGDGAAVGGIPALDDFDYLGFENRFRGPEETVRERQQQHADRLAGLGVVADLGCGRGEFLEILRDRGVEAKGVDQSAQMVALAQEKGLRAEHGDMFAFLATQEPGSLGGILCSHVVEHLWPADHMRLARLAADALRPGGVMIVETPNPKSLIAGSVNFPCDPTHLRPVFPETLAFMFDRAGFPDTEIIYLSRVPDERRARPVTGEPPELRELVEQVNEAVQRLDDLVFGHQDYALVARRGR